MDCLTENTPRYGRISVASARIATNAVQQTLAIRLWTAQQGPSRHSDGSVKTNDTFTQRDLYAFPPELCDELALASNDAVAAFNTHGRW